MDHSVLLKKAAALLLSIVLICGGILSASAAEVIGTGVHIRDPFVLEAGGTYYMYGTGLAWGGYGCVYSQDLQNWSDPVKVFTPPADFDGDGDWWAPECHFYNGSYYLFATYHSSATGKRGVGIFRSESPLGPFENITDGHITPLDRDAIDSTLYVDEDGQPWMVYVGEWTSNEDGIGDMMAAKLSPDLTKFISEPILLFRATDGYWTKGGVTDGPFLYKTGGGRLIMLWSNTDEVGYCVGIAYSSNGKIDGKWRQQPLQLYKKTDKHEDGGHGMLFNAPDGTLMLSIHSPNYAGEDFNEKAVFIPVADIGCTLLCEEDYTVWNRLLWKLYYAFADIRAFFDNIGSTLTKGR